MNQIKFIYCSTNKPQFLYSFQLLQNSWKEQEFNFPDERELKTSVKRI